jgi:DGQHR domain-containing protein
MWDSSALRNIQHRADMIGLARKRSAPVDRMTVRLEELDEYAEQGWTLGPRRKRTAAITRSKRHDVLLEDRVWTLLWRMQFPYLSGQGGATTVINPDSTHLVTSQVDVVGLDDEVCVAVECKSALNRGRRQNLQEELAKHAAVRESLSRAINPPGTASKRTPVLVFWTHNAIVSRNDRERAKQLNIVLLGNEDLTYYETLTHHLGPAARYQFFADLIPGKPIPGLMIRVPALRSRIAGYICYTFAMSPDYLLKIAYVSHRARGKESDVKTYQRMLSRARLRKIAEYIKSEPDAMFPTNIVINLERGEKGKKGSGPLFDPAKQEEGSQGATFGWLTLHPAYKSAWIIDGQHRLYAYSYAGEAKSTKSTLSILAFEGLPGSVQQKLFIDINAEQKSVKRSLLQELYADLHRGADNPRKRTQALISEALQELDNDPDSPFFDRILLAESARTDTRCISFTSLFSALDKPGFYFAAVKDNAVIGPGPFWDKTDDAIISRTTLIVNSWFEAIARRVSDWWDLGAGDGGGLAMNEGVTVCLNVLRSVIEHLDDGKARLRTHTPREIVARIGPYAEELAEHLARMTQEQRLAFRALRGVQGQTAGMRHAQQHLRQAFPSFQPEGLMDFLEREKARTNDRASSLIKEIERILQRVVVRALKEQFGTDGEKWWYEGVPPSVRRPATAHQDEDKNQRGARERYLDFVDYRDIVTNNWQLLGPVLGYGKVRSKDRATEWIVRINETRKVAMHASSATWVSFEQLNELNEYLAWLQTQATEGIGDTNDSLGDESEPLEPA